MTIWTLVLIILIMIVIYSNDNVKMGCTDTEILCQTRKWISLSQNACRNLLLTHSD